MKKVLIKVLTPEFHQLVDHCVNERCTKSNLKIDEVPKYKRLFESELRLVWTGARADSDLTTKYPQLKTPLFRTFTVDLTDEVTISGSPVVIFEGQKIGIFSLPIFDAEGYTKTTLDLSGIVPSESDFDSEDFDVEAIERDELLLEYPDEDEHFLHDAEELYSDPNQN